MLKNPFRCENAQVIRTEHENIKLQREAGKKEK